MTLIFTLLSEQDAKFRILRKI